MEKIDVETKITELTNLAVSECIDPDGLFKKKLKAKIDGSYKGDVVIKLGVDPTRPDIHLGHAVILKKLRAFQDVGCKVIFLVGDYTASIGDPSGKSRVRTEVETAEIEKNMETYVTQVGKILRTDPLVYSWIRNSDWFYGITDLLFDPAAKTSMEVLENGTKRNFPIEANSFVGKALLYENTRMQKTHLGRHETVSLTLKGLLWTLKHISHARLIGRDMFQDRIRRGEELFMNEMLYPVLQGIDSSVIARIYGSCDLEIGGTDQTFNMLLGRDVMRANNQPEQAVMTMPLLVGTDGKEKMSKSLDNYIGITDTPSDMYGKILSIPDTAIASYFELCTYEPAGHTEEMKQAILKGANPRDYKMKLARQIVAIYHGEKKAGEAEEGFVNTFKKGAMPEDAHHITVEKNSPLGDLLVKEGIVESKTEWRRLVTENAVSVVGGDIKIQDPYFKVTENLELKIGKKRFVKVELQ